MSYRHWMLTVAIGGLITLSISPASSLQNQIETERVYKYAAYQVAASDVRPPRAATNPSTYANPCHNTEYGKESDMCQQWRMAEAAEDQRDLTRYLLYATGAEIFALLVVLVFTIRATNAAVNANRIARETAQQELRAYVFVVNAAREFPKILDGGWEVVVEVRNFGQTPARQFRCGIGVAVTTNEVFENANIQDVNLDKRPRHSIGPQGTTYFRLPASAFKGQDLDAFERGDAHIYIFGRFEYIDCFNQPQFTEFAMFHEKGPVKSFGFASTGNNHS